MSLIASVLAAVFSSPLVAAALRIVGLSLLAATATAIVSFVFRARIRQPFPEGATLILGLGVVAIALNTRLVFVQFLGEGGDPFTASEAMLNVAVFIAAGIASYGGRYAGDKVAASNRITLGRFQPSLSPIVRAAGRFITVTLPDEIDDIEGYDPVEEETKKALAGRSIDFPRGLTLDELQSQLVARLKEEYDIGYVDVDLTTEGAVEYLGVGQRAAGLGPTLPPKSAAVAVRSDPPFSATPGDTVQVWRTGDESGAGEQRLGTAELRASVGRVATLAMDRAAADRIDSTVEHRLMTLSADSHPDREFAAMLRRGDETMSIVEITAESPLIGSSVGALAVTVIAVRSAGGDVETIPKRDRLVQAGDSLFAIGRPEALRRLETSKGAEVTESGDGVRDAASGAVLFGLETEGGRRRPDKEDWTDYGEDM